MKHTSRKIFAVLLAAALLFSLLSATGCTFAKDSDKEDDAVQNAPDGQNSPDIWDFSDDTEDMYGTTGTDVKSVGNFTTQDINKNTVTADIFKKHELTMVNVFATWCSPCVEEMPDLEKLHQQMKDNNVGVVGVVLDVLNEKGHIVEDELKTAQLLVKETGVTYPVLLPDSTYFNGRLIGIEAIPETFFVDKDGNIVGESYSGSGSLEDWTEVVESELASLEEGE